MILHPRWRGLKLGLLAVRKMIDLLGGGCGLTVSDIRPVIPEAHSRLEVPRAWLPEHPTREDHRLACQKLRRHFRRMGFQRIRGSRLFAMSMAHVVPTAAELIRPGT